MSDRTDAAYEKAMGRIEQMRPYMGGIIAILRKVYEQGPQAAPFDEAGASERIFYAADTHNMRCMYDALPKPSAKDRERYKQIAAALNEALKLLADEAKAEAGGALMICWYDEFIEPIPLGETPKDRRLKERERFNSVIEEIEQLSKAASDSAELVAQETERGHPRGGAQIRSIDIVELAAIFREYTGAVPTIPHTRPMTRHGHEIDVEPTPFVRFVERYLIATDRSLAPSTLVKKVKEAKVWSLGPDNLEQSPFQD
jgi:hypothetical protein